MNLTCGSERLTTLDDALRREWLLANGIGGFASATVVGANTRRYHALLIAALQPPGGRVALLSKMEETIQWQGAAIELATNEYPGAIYPQGFERLIEFRFAPWPTFVFSLAEGVTLEKSVFLPQGSNAVCLRYRLKVSDPHQPLNVVLQLRPLIAFRDYHSTTHANPALSSNVEASPNHASVEPYGDLPPLHFAFSNARLQTTGQWLYRFQYAREKERGLDSEEDLFEPFSLEFDLNGEADSLILASVEQHSIEDFPTLEEKERQRQTPFRGNTLAEAASAFFVSRNEDATVIAGYPWFTDWGRDTMIALPGLTLAANNQQAARSILTAFSKKVDQGMLPNRFLEDGQSCEYNTVDATLWFFEAARSLNDPQFVKTALYETLCDILRWHARGTRYNIRLDPADGLLWAGDPGTQLTWMDARVNGIAVTPRFGKPVEIQALWYNALCVTAAFADRFQDDTTARWCREIAQSAASRFHGLFWNHEENCLYDVVGPDGPDRAIRPNQIFAVSLPHSLLDAAKSKRVVDCVKRHLLTPYGLRTLSPQDSRFRGRYEGPPESRDAAYHQGTVWPWLIGPFVSAWLRTGGSEVHALEFLQPLKAWLEGPGLHQIPELFDGSQPQLPRGCTSQAWSIGEFARVWNLVKKE